ncbi:MAG: DUF892 family protein [wastewater metagenome]|nr:DUF892 family protein [Candidatus Loosdrechtia aerotolerans]
MDNMLEDVKSIALRMEMDGIKLYNNLASRTSHPMGKAMFRSFVEDEKMHVKRLRALLFNSGETSRPMEKAEANSGQRLINVFQKMGNELKKRVNASTSDIDAIKLAMKVEEDGITFYEHAGRETENIKEKEVYHFLANEEKLHFHILKNTLKYLEQKELWEAENEGRIYDMWMNTVNKIKNDE